MNDGHVFASNELNLSDINVYGFDYDYTIAQYEPSVEQLIYELGKKELISKYRVSIIDVNCLDHGRETNNYFFEAKLLG